LLLQRPRPISGPVTLLSAAGKPNLRRRDADNQPEAMHAQQVIADAANVV